MNDFYTTAKDARNKTYMYLGIAASLWATDIIYTIIRGNINKQKQLKQKQPIGSNWKLNVYTDYYSFNIGLKKEIK